MSVVAAAGGVEQCRAALVLQLSPQGQCLLGQPHVFRLVVGQTENAGAAVGASTEVTRLEAIEDDDVAAPLGQPPCSCRPHRPRADDDDIAAFQRNANPTTASSSSSALSGSSTLIVV